MIAHQLSRPLNERLTSHQMAKRNTKMINRKLDRLQAEGIYGTPYSIPGPTKMIATNLLVYGSLIALIVIFWVVVLR
jgi:hypothetical protein